MYDFEIGPLRVSGKFGDEHCRVCRVSHIFKIFVRGFKMRIVIKCLNLLYVSLICTTEICAYDDDDSRSIANAIYYQITNVLPIHYTVTLRPFMQPAAFAFLGECNINIEIQHATKRIPVQLNLDYITYIQEASLIDNETIYEPTNRIYYEMFIVELVFNHEFSPGFYTLQLIFDAKQSPKKRVYGLYNKLYRDTDGNVAWLAMKPFMTVAVRGDLLCYDYPQLKPTFDIFIIHEEEYTVLSNMPLQEQSEHESGIIMSHFETTPQMSSCEVMVAVFNFSRVSNEDETVNIWCRRHMTSKIKFAQSVAGTVAQHMIEFTNISKKIDYIALPHFTTRDIANWRLVVYKEEDIIYDVDIHLEDHKKCMAKLITHQIIQCWFYNWITPISYQPDLKSSDSWLNTGLVYFLEAYILDKISKNWQIMDFLAIKNLSLCFYSDINTNSFYSSAMEPLISGDNKDRYLNYFYNTRIYEMTASLFQDKGPLILRMLQHLITDKLFWDGISLFLRTYQFKSVTTDNLWDTMESVLNDGHIFEDVDIKTIMDPWIRQKNYPLVTVKRDKETGLIKISQMHVRSQIDKIMPYPWDTYYWYIPVTYTTQAKSDFTNTSDQLWLSTMNNSLYINISTHEWIIVNLQRIGYYRVNYDPTNWQKIADYLNFDNYTKIHINNRVQLIDDAFYLMCEKQLDPNIFYDLTNYLSRTTDYASWYPMFSILPRLKNSSLLQDKNSKERLANDFLRFLNGIKYGDDTINEDDFIKEKTFEAIQWACKYSALCQKLATNKLQKYLEDNSTHKISSRWSEWIYCTGLSTANLNTWNKVLRLYSQYNDDKFLYYLTCSENPTIIIYYLNILWSKELIIKHQFERDNTFFDIITKHAGNNMVLDYILENLERVKFKGFGPMKLLNYIYRFVTTKEQQDKVNFISPKSVLTDNKIEEKRKNSQDK